MSDEKLAEVQARVGAYRLFSCLFSNELDEEMLDFLREQSALLAEFSFPLGQELVEGWLQAQRVEYARLFLMNVYPYESIYTGAEVMLNTSETEQVNFFYQDFGFSSEQKVFPDHIGVELEFMGTLAEHEAYALQKDLTLQAAHLAHAARDFLQQHLLAWLPAFTLALGRITTSDFYRSVAEETLAFVSLDFQYLTENLYQSGKRAGLMSALSTSETESEVVAANEQGLPSLVNHLITPVKAGFYLSKLEIFRLAQSMQLPPEGDDRFQMLKSLFEVAAQYEMLGHLIGKLLELVERYQVEFARLQEEFAVADHIWQSWQHRLENSHKMLEEMQEALIN